MGLFSRPTHSNTAPSTQYAQSQPQPVVNQNVPPPGANSTTTTTTASNSGKLFSKRKSTPPAAAAAAPVQPQPVQQHPVDNKSYGLFSRGSKRRGSSSSSSGELPHGYAFSKNDGLAAARSKLAAAQEAEAAADAALIRSRNAVKEARAKIVALEREAEMEAKQAREKQKMAKGLRSEGMKLGRHL